MQDSTNSSVSGCIRPELWVARSPSTPAPDCGSSACAPCYSHDPALSWKLWSYSRRGEEQRSLGTVPRYVGSLASGLAVACGQTWLNMGRRVWVWFKLNFVDSVPALPEQSRRRKLLKQESYILLTHRAAKI